MTVADYMSPTSFPRTTEPGLTPEQQFVIDAFNLAQLRELRDGGHILTRGDLARLAELEKKAAARPELLAQLGEAGGGH